MLFRAFDLGVEEIWVACGTKFGKTTSGAVAEANALVTKGKEWVWRWIAPRYSQSLIGKRYIQKFVPPEPWTSSHGDPVPHIVLKDTGSRIEFWHTRKPEDLEGEGVHGNVHDEMAKQHPDAYSAAKTTRTFTKRVQPTDLYFSTPLGKNHFYKGCMNAKDEMHWALKRKQKPKKLFIQARSYDNIYTNMQVIKEMKRDLPERLYKQYVEAEFMDDGTVFVGFKDCFNTPLIDLQGDTQHWIHQDAKKFPVVIGADWGKHKDYVCFTAIRTDGPLPELVGYFRFRKVKYTTAVKELYIFAQRFHSVVIVQHDRTGVGDAIDDILAQTPLPFEGIVFTNQSKASMVNDLILCYERKGMWMPRIAELEKELEMFEVNINASGLSFSYSAPEGFHDDIVCSLLLSYNAYHEFAGTSGEVKWLEDLPTDNSILDHYRDIIADDDDADFESLLGRG